VYANLTIVSPSIKKQSIAQTLKKKLSKHALNLNYEQMHSEAVNFITIYINKKLSGNRIIKFENNEYMKLKDINHERIKAKSNKTKVIVHKGNHVKDLVK
jgi:hypothetical protein